MIHNKSQSALEYLMTYGWAILIIVIVAAVLYSTGVFSPSSNTTTTITGLGGFQKVTAGCLVTPQNTSLEVSLANGVGTLIKIDQINVTYPNGTIKSMKTNITIPPGEVNKFIVPDSGCTSISYYRIKLGYYEPTNVFNSSTVAIGSISGPTPKIYTYNTTFDESGLPISYQWYVEYSDATKSSTSSSIIFYSVNGSYSFSAKTLSNSSSGCTTTYTPSPDTSTLKAGDSISISFSSSTSCNLFPPFMLATASSGYSPANLSVINMTSDKIIKNATVGLNDSESVVESPNGTFAYVGNIVGYVSFVNTKQGKIVKNVTGLNNVRGEALTPNGTILYVAEYGDSKIAVINTETGAISYQIPVPDISPWDIQLWPQKDLLYVEAISGNVSIINTTAQKVVKNVSIPQRSSYGSIALDIPKDKFYVSLADSGVVEVFNLTTDSFISNIPLSQPSGMAISKDGALLYVTDFTTPGSVSIVNTTTESVIATVPMPGPLNIALSPNVDEAYAVSPNGYVEVINTSTELGIKNITLSGPGDCISGGFKGCP